MGRRSCANPPSTAARRDAQGHDAAVRAYLRRSGFIRWRIRKPLQAVSDGSPSQDGNFGASMIFADAMRAFGQVLSPEFRRVLMKSLALTIAILALVWLALTRLFDWWLDGHGHRRRTIPGSTPMPAFSPGSASWSRWPTSFRPSRCWSRASFLTRSRRRSSARATRPSPPGRPLPPRPLVWEAASFAVRRARHQPAGPAVPGSFPASDLVAFFIANTFLLGREYFELAASRFQAAAGGPRHARAAHRHGDARRRAHRLHGRACRS